MDRIKEFINQYLKNRDLTLDDVFIESKEKTMDEYMQEAVEVEGLTKKDLISIAHIYQISLSSAVKTYQHHKANFNFNAFFDDVQKIKPYKKSESSNQTVSLLNAYCFSAILDKNINNYRVFNIEVNDNAISHIIDNHNKEILYIYQSNTFNGISYEQYIIYCAIQSILTGTDGEQKIYLKQIYETVYNTRWDKATLDAKYHLLEQIKNLNYNLSGNSDNGISTVTYIYNGDKRKLKIGEKVPYRGIDFFGYAVWDFIKDWDMPNHTGGKAYSLQEQRQNNYDNTFFMCKRGNFANIVSEQKRITTIPKKLIVARNIKNNIMVNYYIARHILLANNEKNHIKPVILFATMEKYLGAVSREVVKNIMENAKKQGYITNYKISAKRIEFNYDEKAVTVMKNQNKDVVQVNVIPEDVTEREKQIRELNHYYSKHHVTLNGKTLSTDLRQVFNNNDWYQGGRLYTSKNGYQAVKSADRNDIQIDGKNTVELDYSSCQIALLYAYEGLQAPADCYNYFPDRPLAKMALNIAINAETKTKAIQALYHNWNNAHPSKQIKEKNAESVIEDAIKAHQPISKYIASGAGVGLQRLDSDIALSVVYRLKQEHILALPVHDSFIVDARYKDKLMQVMLEEYSNYTGGFSINIK